MNARRTASRGLLAMAMACSALASPAATSSTASGVRAQLRIREAAADLTAGVLKVRGEHFITRWRGDLQVTLAGASLDVLESSATEITAVLPLDILPGTYRLVVIGSRGPVRQADAMDLTIGAVGPQGPPGLPGPMGDPGPPGLPGNLALANQACAPGAFVTGFDAQGNLVCAAPPRSTCGNGLIEPGEECDDRNVNPGDGCSAACEVEPPICGNGRVEAGEQCDDGNLVPGDGCSATCTFERRADVVFLVDSSGSTGALRAAVGAGLNAFAQALSPRLDLHIVLVGNGLCVPAPLGSGACPADERLPGFRHLAVSVGSNNALEVLLQQYPSYASSLRAGAPKHIVVFTDGDSSLSASAFTAQADAVGLAGFVFHGLFVRDLIPVLPGGPLIPECGAAVGAVYETLVGATGGVAGDLCEDSVDSFLGQVATAILAPHPSITQACSHGESGIDRDCGFTEQSSGTCVAGGIVILACSALCGLGSCAGDPFIRICAGDVDCVGDRTLASNDDAGCQGAGTLDSCPEVQFACPSSGRYTVAWGPFEAGRSATCAIASTEAIPVSRPVLRRPLLTPPVREQTPSRQK